MRLGTLSLVGALKNCSSSSVPKLKLLRPHPSVFGRPVCYFSTKEAEAPSPAKGQDQDDKVKGGARKHEEDFIPLDIIKSKGRERGFRRKRERKEVAPPRYLKMPVDQDWGSVWPTARTFHPASVPLPLHQGYQKAGSGKAAPDKWGNLELMKIPNFLHLTPPVVKRQCEALKKFCTPWPEQLKDNAVLEELFPIEIITNDYCHSLPTIRDPRARIVTLQVPMSILPLDYHGKDKLLRLLVSRYDPSTDLITLTVENCPLRKQNYEYAMYLLTALYHEAWNKEKWEVEKSEQDMEHYVWEGSVSQKNLGQVLALNVKDGEEFPVTPSIEKYRDAVLTLHNEGEDVSAMDKYGSSVRELLNLPSLSSSS